MRLRYELLALLLLTLAGPRASDAQEVIISSARPGHGFNGYSSMPISPIAVVHGYMDASDSGATLGFAVVIRGPSGWYDTSTKYGEIAADSLPAGTIGQWWQVGGRRYRFVYDRARMTLALFDTVMDVSRSRVVLVTLPPEATARATVGLGQPVSVEMTEPTSFAGLLLPRSPEVRSFAGLTRP